jgi:uncharacterized membrane protein YkoI
MRAPVKIARRRHDRSAGRFRLVIVTLFASIVRSGAVHASVLEQTMTCGPRFVIAVPFAVALVFAFATASVQVRAEEPDHAAAAAAAETARACLNQKERRLEGESGKLVRLETAIHAAHTRMAGTVVRARLCHSQAAGRDDGLVYVLTVLAHDGKVARIEVDAVKGTLIGGL